MTAGDVEVVRGTLDSRQAVALDGTDDYILADAHAVARVLAADTVGTYTAWIYKDSTDEGVILSVGDNSSANELLKLYYQSELLKVELKHGGVVQFRIVQDSKSLSTKKWNHVAVVQDGVNPILSI